MAALKALIGKLEDVAEGVRSFYKAHGAQFVLDLEGAVPGFVAEKDHNDVKTSLTEFRTNNIAVMKERDDLKEQFKDLDPAAARAAIAEIAKLKGKGMSKADDLEAMIAAAVKPLTDQITGLKTSLNEKDQAAVKATLRTKLSEALIGAGVKRTALVDALNRADGRFKLDGESLIEMEGSTPKFSAKNPGKPREIAEWAAELAAGDGSHLFEPSKGGGASGGGTGGSDATTIAFDPKSFLKNLDAIANGTVKVDVPS